jgi:hypothetical protein
MNKKVKMYRKIGETLFTSGEPGARRSARRVREEASVSNPGRLLSSLYAKH